MTKKSAENKTKAKRQKFRPKKHAEVTSEMHYIAKEVKKWKKYFFDKDNKYPKGVVLPKKKEFTEVAEKIETLGEYYMTLCKLKRKNVPCSFNKPFFVEEAASNFIVKNNLFKEKVEFALDKTAKMALMTENLFKKALMFYIKRESLELEKPIGFIELNSELVKLMQSKFPNITNEDKVKELPDIDEEDYDEMIQYGKKDVIYISKDYFKTLLEEFVTEHSPIIIKEELTKRMKELNAQLDNQLGEVKKREPDLQIITPKEFGDKVKEVVSKFNQFKDIFYAKDDQGRDFKRKGNYPEKAPNKKEINSTRKQINELTTNYQHIYIKTIKNPDETLSVKGFNRIVKVPLNLGNLCKLDKFGFPKEDKFYITTPSTITAMISLYVECKSLRNEKNRKIFAADKDLLEVIKDSLKGKTKKGVKYSFKADELSTTCIQTVLSPLQISAKDHKKTQEVLQCAKVLSDKRSKRKSAKKEIKKMEEKVSLILEKIEELKDTYPTLKKFYNGEKKGLEDEISKLQNEVKTLTKELNF